DFHQRLRARTSRGDGIPSRRQDGLEDPDVLGSVVDNEYLRLMLHPCSPSEYGVPHHAGPLVRLRPRIGQHYEAADESRYRISRRARGPCTELCSRPSSSQPAVVTAPLMKLPI